MVTQRVRKGMSGVRKAAVAFATSSLLIGAVLAAPQMASASEDPHCGAKEEVYSADGFQYGKFQLCLSNTDGKLFSQVLVSELQYKWGGTWYNNTESARLDGDMVVQRNGATMSSSKISQGTSGTEMSFLKETPVSVPGLYKVTAQAQVNGLYWSEDASSRIVAPPLENSQPIAGR